MKNILVLIGPTGSGKTSVGVRLAQLFDGEIISADSRAIYKGMNIGTAKPSVEEQCGITHYGINLVYPNERFTVYDFKNYALNKISEIRNKGKVPIIVGGTGLYVDALVFDYSFDEDSKKGRLDRRQMLDEYRIIGIKIERDVLRERLKKRIDLMFELGIEEETRKLFTKYDHKLQALRSDIYPIVWEYCKGSIDLETAKNKAFLKDWNLAGRQMTWFRRNKNIEWMGMDEILALDKLFV